MPKTYTGIMKKAGTVPSAREPKPKPSSRTGVKVNPEAVAKIASKVSQPSTSVRFRDPAVRQMLREVSDAAGLSQRELIEEAVARDLLFRGARIVSDLEAAAKRIRALRPSAYMRLMERSIVEFAEGEAEREPIRAEARHSAPGGVMEEGLRPDLDAVLTAFGSTLGSSEAELNTALFGAYEVSDSIGRRAPALRGN